MNEDTLLEVVNCLSFQEMKKGETVMEFGDVGNKFYLILQGEVEIHIPDPNRKQDFREIKKDLSDAIEIQKQNNRFFEQYLKHKEK